MSLTVSIGPDGRLLAAPDTDAAPALATEIAARIQDAFRGGSSSGLLLLVSRDMPRELPPSLVFWREFTNGLLHAVCQLGEGAEAKWQSAPPPADYALSQLVAEAPPMPGLENLSAQYLTALWEQLRDRVAKEAAHFPEGPAAYLHSINPVWRLLGRVTFHLAENKRDPDRPFAFLATYTHRLSSNARVAHLPLADAVGKYAGAKDKATLESLLEPVRRAAERSKLVRELLDSRKLFAPQAWSIHQAHRFLQECAGMEDAGVVVRVPNWWSARRPPRPQVDVRIGSRPASELGVDSLLDFQIGLTFDGDPLTDEEREALLANTDGLALIRGKWVEVDRQRLEQVLDHWKQVAADHPDGVTFIEGMRMLSGVQLAADEAPKADVADWSRVTTGDWLGETLKRLRSPELVDAFQPGRELQATLRPYQADGVRWLWFMTQLGLGACLADDMGLGKTIQMIDLVVQRKRESSPESRKPTLLVVPASLIGNWLAEIQRFAPHLSVACLHRSECDATELAAIAAAPARKLATFDLAIVTYSMVRKQPWLEQVEWSLVVLDEAQAIKNAGSIQTRSVKKLRGAGRIALTGTPVENHLGDLWSLFDFCNPGLLGTAGQFKKYVNRLTKDQDAHAFGSLRKLVRPYILRRMKTDPAIVPDLPEKTEMRTECNLSRRQAVLYEQVVEELSRRLEEADGIARRGLVLSSLMQLKQICNHPSQFLKSGAFEPAESGKFERLALLCEPVVARQEKMLLFTQFQSLTEPLAEYLATMFGRPGLVLHGGTPVRKRTELVGRFQNDSQFSFFVVSLKAGGSGLNLTAASHVVHFDRWWNPAVENQATDRAFRIGQKRNVLVHKFVCRGTLEERIDAMIRGKQALADNVLGEDAEPLLTEMSDDQLLRFVALDVGRATAGE